MNTEENFIPRKFQEDKILLFNKNEFVIFFLFASTGMLLKHLLVGIFAGFIVIKLLKKWNKTGRQAFLIGFVYWHLPPSLIRFKKTPPSFMQVFTK